MALKLGSNLDLSKVVKSLGQKMVLVPHIDLAIGEGDFDWEFKYTPKAIDDAWHPSGDCTPSLHDLYLKATGQAEVQPFGPGLYKIFMVGHFFHQYLQWVVQHKLAFAGSDEIERRGMKVWKRYEAPSVLGPAPVDIHTGTGVWRRDGTWEGWQRPYHWATGSADICPCRIPGDGEYLVDFKTVNPRMYAMGMNPGYLEKWECQGNIYMDFFDMERALFVMIDKSNGDMKEMVFERNQPLIDAIYKKWRLVGECVTEGIEPPEGEDIDLPLTGPVGT